MPFSQPSYLGRYAANYLHYKSIDFQELASKVTQKTLLMCGSHDIQTNTASTQKIGNLIKNSRIYLDPQGDHYGLLRDNSNTLKYIWNYLLD